MTGGLQQSVLSGGYETRRKKSDEKVFRDWTKMWGKTCVFTVCTSGPGSPLESLAYGQGIAKKDRFFRDMAADVSRDQLPVGWLSLLGRISFGITY